METSAEGAKVASRMRLSVFGGTRGTGLRVIEMAVAEGCQVTALARRPHDLTQKFPGIRVVSGDVHALEPVKTTVNHSDAVISTLGVAGRSRQTDIYSVGVLNVARAMQELGLKRLIVVAAIPGIDPRPDVPWYASAAMRLFLVPMFGGMYRDMAKMSDLIAQTNLDWTIVGVPNLTNSPGKGAYRSSIGKPLHHPLRISRTDVAHYLLSIISDPTTFRKRTEIAW